MSDLLTPPSTPPRDGTQYAGEEQVGRCIPSAIKHKFSFDNFYGTSPVKKDVVFYGSTPFNNDKSGLLKVPSHLILENLNIEKAGNPDVLNQMCNDLLELDLSRNNISDISEILIVLKQSPKLLSLLLSGNPLNSTIPEPLPSHEFMLKSIILTATKIPLSVLALILPSLIVLEEMHLSFNHYTSTSGLNLNSCSSLKFLYFNDNLLERWSDACHLCKCFPNISTLVLTGNKFTHIPPDDEETISTMNKLNCLHLGRNPLASWEDLRCFSLLPNITDIRLHGLDFFSKYTDKDRRNITIARLKHITRLNASEISRVEREDAERFFLRHHLKDEEKPFLYDELEAIHGRLEPLVDLNLGAYEINLNITCLGYIGSRDLLINPNLTVSDLRKKIQSLYKLKTSNFVINVNNESFTELKDATMAIHATGLVTDSELVVTPVS